MTSRPASTDNTPRSPEEPTTHIPALERADTQLEHDVDASSVEQPDVAAEEAGLELARSRTISRSRAGRLPSVPEKRPLPKGKVLQPFDVRIVALLMPAAVFGLLARLGLEGLTTYPGASIFNLAWVQVVGCLVMGLLIGIREPLSEFYPEMYIALSSGFCGSVTTFSSWQVDVFLAWSNRTTAGGLHRLWIYDVMDGLTRLLFTLALSVASVKFGYHVSSGASPTLQKWFNDAGGLVPPVLRSILAATGIVIYALTIPLYFVLTSRFRGKATAALLFSFPGAFSRYFLSIRLNPLRKSFPVGTFTANALGTLLLAIFYVSERTRGGSLSFTSCVMLKGLSDGYCGCLSTVSTFASELTTLEKWKAWRYCVISVLVGQILVLVVIGGAEWCGNVRDVATCKLRPS